MKTFTLPRLARGALLVSALFAGLAFGADVKINLVGTNDFHGHLEEEPFTIFLGRDVKPSTKPARGAGLSNIGAILKSWRAEDPQLLLVGGGDVVGGSPPLSAMLADEPSIEAWNLLGMRASSLGNHEFDAGLVELRRKQNGGCPVPANATACQRGDFKGAKFEYLAANLREESSGKLLFPAATIAEVKGVKIALIGAVLHGMRNVVKKSAVEGIAIDDPAEAINKQIPLLKKQGATVFVVLIHEGGFATEAFDKSDCSTLSGEIVKVTQRLDPAVRLVVSGHTHTGYTCRVDGRMVTQAGRFGQVLTRIQLTVDGDSKEVKGVAAQNVAIVTNELPRDAALDALLADVKERGRIALEKTVGRIAVKDIIRSNNAAGESPMGNLVADAHLHAARPFGAQLAITNTGGIRAELHTTNADNIVTVGEVGAVQPFGNELVVASFTGAQIKRLLAQQRQDGGSGMQTSANLRYSWDAKRPLTERVIPESVTFDGKPIDDNAVYRVSLPDFVLESSERMPVLKEARDVTVTNIKDQTALIDYIAAMSRAGKPAGSSQVDGRVTKVE